MVSRVGLEGQVSRMTTSALKGAAALLDGVTPELVLNETKNPFDVPSVEVAHKAIWGLFVGYDLLEKAGRHEGAARYKLRIDDLLDCLRDNALRENHDFYFTGEPVGHKDMQRLYRATTFLKVAAWLNHPLAADANVIGRALKYQHESGAVFNFIGNDEGNPEFPETAGTLNTSFFGHWALATQRLEGLPLQIGDEQVRSWLTSSGLSNRAYRAAKVLANWVNANKENMGRGVIYTNWVAKTGELVTPDHPLYPSDYNGQVNLESAKQEFWQVGTTIAYLCNLYDKRKGNVVGEGGVMDSYLAAAERLLEFADQFNGECYDWASMCKCAWGAGEYLRVVSERNLTGKLEYVKKAVRVGSLAVARTFMDKQGSNGLWGGLNYPISDSVFAELDSANRFGPPLILNRPTEIIPLPGVEITGEFLGELHAYLVGVKSLLLADRYVA